MCNLCSSRLFLVPNPCCCCDLQCGVQWVGIFEILIGLVSLYFPSTLTVLEEGSLNADRPAGAALDDVEEPVFDVIVPWSDSKWFRNIQKTGCYTIQIVFGVVIILAANGLGGHSFAKFIVGCIWLVMRVTTMLIMLAFTSKLRATQHKPLVTYANYIWVKALVDIYFIVVVRYYTMDSYDTYRYNKSERLHTIARRAEPMVSKSAPKSKKPTPFKPFWKKSPKDEEPDTVPQALKDIYQKKKVRDYHDMEPAPVWDRKNEVIFYGEDYTDWDPHLFLTKWEQLNEEQTKKKGKKSMAAAALESFRGDLPGAKRSEIDDMLMKRESNAPGGAQRVGGSMGIKASLGGQGDQRASKAMSSTGRGRGRGGAGPGRGQKWPSMTAVKKAAPGGPGNK